MLTQNQVLKLSDIHRPDPKHQVVKKYNLKATLRELGLKAVIEHKNHLIMCDLDGLKYLRKILCRHYFKANKYKCIYLIIYSNYSTECIAQNGI